MLSASYQTLASRDVYVLQGEPVVLHEYGWFFLTADNDVRFYDYTGTGHEPLPSEYAFAFNSLTSFNGSHRFQAHDS